MYKRLKRACTKACYQLYFLFESGNPNEFIELYSMDIDDISYGNHIRAAMLFAATNNTQHTKKFIARLL